MLFNQFAIVAILNFALGAVFIGSAAAQSATISSAELSGYYYIGPWRVISGTVEYSAPFGRLLVEIQRKGADLYDSEGNFVSEQWNIVDTLAFGEISSDDSFERTEEFEKFYFPAQFDSAKIRLVYTHATTRYLGLDYEPNFDDMELLVEYGVVFFKTWTGPEMTLTLEQNQGSGNTPPIND